MWPPRFVCSSTTNNRKALQAIGPSGLPSASSRLKDVKDPLKKGSGDSLIHQESTRRRRVSGPSAADPTGALPRDRQVVLSTDHTKETCCHNAEDPPSGLNCPTCCVHAEESSPGAIAARPSSPVQQSDVVEADVTISFSSAFDF